MYFNTFYYQSVTVKKFKNCWKTWFKKIDISSKITLKGCYDFQVNMPIFPFVCNLSGNNIVLTDLLWKNRWRLDYLIPQKVHRKPINWNNKLNYWCCVQSTLYSHQLLLIRHCSASRFLSNESQVAVYNTSHELLVTCELGVAGYCTSSELLFKCWLRLNVIKQWLLSLE